MLDYIYEWMENIAFYMVIVVAAMQMVPGDGYKKIYSILCGNDFDSDADGTYFKTFWNE